MLATRTLIVTGSFLLLVGADAWSRPDLAPDQVRLNDGTELRGLILLNTSDTVVIQTATGEARIPKEYIRRIDDAPNGEAIFADILEKDELPSWRSIVHDLRTHDSVYLFEQIPPTRIDNGLLRNIPYLSFRVNDKWEMNVYGNPDNPVAVEFGIYGSDKSSIRTFREFIAGHLHAKEQIAALYRLGPQNRHMRAGKLSFRFIRPDDPDGYGGSWIVVYRPDRIEKARLSDKKYAAITRPFEEVNNPDGSLRADKMDENIGWLDRMMEMITGEDPELRGFYRDKNGVFRVLTSES